MPNQLAAVRTLTENVVGAQIWDQRVGECETMPTSAYDELEERKANGSWPSVTPPTARSWPRSTPTTVASATGASCPATH
ncbi:hypothetical protein GCM10009577_36870 [Streptomyces javensis]